MIRIPWYVTAFTAAVIWGLHYPLLDHALKRISLVTVLFLTAIPFLCIALVFHRQIAADFHVVRALPVMSQVAIASIALTSAAASTLLFISIGGKNATLASLIEISYPLFVALFAYLLFREVALNTGVVVGAALVFAGVALVILNSR